MAGYFAVFLVLLTLASGLVWLLDALVLAPKRQQKLALAQASAGGSLGLEASEQLVKEPQIVETAKSIFPVIALITLFRSFIYEPFQIPSGSMMPTLLVGDFILVEKFSYDVKDPVWRKTLYSNNKPQRGDVEPPVMYTTITTDISTALDSTSAGTNRRDTTATAPTLGPSPTLGRSAGWVYFVVAQRRTHMAVQCA